MKAAAARARPGACVRQEDAETVNERGLGGIGLGYAAQADLAMGCGRQDNVVRLNAGELFENGARGVSETGSLCHISRLFHRTKARKQTRIWA